MSLSSAVDSNESKAEEFFFCKDGCGISIQVGDEKKHNCIETLLASNSVLLMRNNQLQMEISNLKETSKKPKHTFCTLIMFVLVIFLFLLI